MRDVKGIGKDKGQSEKIRAEREYGKGKYWNELSRNANLSKKSKGQTRVDAEGDAYKFDPKHKTTKVHLHRYRHKGGNKWKLIEEVDPETGETIRSINGDVEIWG